jgi:CelD/BcsL family acetyltransferase involved in cellulose biosynthesis
VRLLGHGAGDELGPVCAPGDRGAAADALRRALRVTRAHVFVGEQLRGDAGWTPLLGGRVLTREGSPVTPLEGRSWNDLLAARSSNFREQVRRRERKLAREHELRYRLTADASSLAADLDVLFALHRASRAAGSSFGGRAAEAFHRDFAALALERGWLRLWTLELDGVPAAAWYGFRFEDAESYYQLGRDPAFDRLSVGFVLLSHTIRAALEDGAREYRFLRGGESYKYRFADSDPGLETIGLARGPLGAVALAAASGARAVRRALRARRARARGRAPT